MMDDELNDDDATRRTPTTPTPTTTTINDREEGGDLLIGVLDGLRLGTSRIPLYSLLFFCRQTGGEIKLHPLECADAGWFDRDHLPTPILGAERWADSVFAAFDGEHRDVYYDTLRRPVWRGES